MSRDGAEEPAAGRGRQPAALADVLSQLASRRGWADRLHDSQVHARWPDIAGAHVAAHAEPVRLHGGVLVVRAESGAWAAQLRYLAPRLVARAQEVLGSDRVHRVQIVSGDAADRPRRGASG